MNKYQKIKDLGLEIFEFGFANIKYVKADDLLKVLDAGVDVTGMHNSVWDFSEMDSDSHTYQAIVIGIKELKPKQVTITREDLKTAFSDGFGIVDISYFDVIAKRLGL